MRNLFHLYLPLFLFGFAQDFDFGRLLSEIKYSLPAEKNNITIQKNKGNKNYIGKFYGQQTFFPSYAKTSKMINGNRRGSHSKLERRLKSKSPQSL